MKQAIDRIESVSGPGTMGAITYGSWLRLNLRDREFTAGGTSANHRVTFHGTAFESLLRIIAKGMEVGPACKAQDSKEVRGVFGHKLEQNHLCQLYMQYSPFASNGWYFAPLLQLRSPNEDPQYRKTILKRKKTNDQYISYPDCVEVETVFAHYFHASEMLSGGGKHEWCWAEPMFSVCHELDPQDSWEDIAARSWDSRPMHR